MHGSVAKKRCVELCASHLLGNGHSYLLKRSLLSKQIVSNARLNRPILLTQEPHTTHALLPSALRQGNRQPATAWFSARVENQFLVLPFKCSREFMGIPSRVDLSAWQWHAEKQETVMFENYEKLSKKLEVDHPVLLAPMDLVAGGKLAAAVTEAGGLGIIGGGYGDEAWLREQFAAARGARVGVGFITWSLSRQPHLIDVCIEHSPVAVMFSFGDASRHIEKVKAAGILSICQVQTAAMAREAVAYGADIIVAQGAEGGGHGVACGTISLVPTVVDAVGDEVPVVAAGGIADGRGFAASLALGASGVVVGTRFYASEEAIGHADAKRRIVQCKGGEETIRGILFDMARSNVWPAPFTGRVLRNQFSDQWVGRERDLLQQLHVETPRYLEARANGDFDTAAVIAGESAGLVHDILPARTIVANIVSEMREILGYAGLSGQRGFKAVA
jgi:nitronate monooxygenase